MYCLTVTSKTESPLNKVKAKPKKSKNKKSKNQNPRETIEKPVEEGFGYEESKEIGPVG